MLNWFQVFLVFLSALTVIVGDALVKKVSTAHSFVAAFENPWMFVVYGLYFIQILLAIYIFIYKGELAIYVNLYVIFYGILGILAGVLFFDEKITVLQFAGIFLGIVGAVLMNGTG